MPDFFTHTIGHTENQQSCLQENSVWNVRIYNKGMLCKHNCVKFRGQIAWHSFLENNLAEFLDEVRVKINQDYVQLLVAFLYGNIRY